MKSLGLHKYHLWKTLKIDIETKKESLVWDWLDFHLFFFKEKAPYEEKAAKRKAEYEKQMDAYNKNMVSFLPDLIYIQTLTWLTLISLQYGQEEGSDESEKSRSEVNDEDEASGEVTHIKLKSVEFLYIFIRDPFVICSVWFLKVYVLHNISIQEEQLEKGKAGDEEGDEDEDEEEDDDDDEEED